MSRFFPLNGGCVLPIAKWGRLEQGWFIEGDGWTMTPRGILTIPQARLICIHSAAAVRRALAGGGAPETASLISSDG